MMTWTEANLLYLSYNPAHQARRQRGILSSIANRDRYARRIFPLRQISTPDGKISDMPIQARAHVSLADSPQGYQPFFWHPAPPVKPASRSKGPNAASPGRITQPCMTYVRCRAHIDNRCRAGS